VAALRTIAVPAGLEPADTSPVHGPTAPHAGSGAAPPRWAPEEIERLLRALATTGAQTARGLDRESLLDAWDATMEAFLDPSSRERRALLEPATHASESAFVRATRLSPAGLAAALDVVLGGLRRPSTERLADLLARSRISDPKPPRAVYLASNIPALAAQPLLRALLEGRAVLLKSASVEPFFAPSLVRALVARLPALSPAVAAVTWPGSRADFDEHLLAHGFDLELYGGADAVAALKRRAPSLLAHGPMASLGIVAADADLETAAHGLARDVALFDQRGCLSVQEVYVEGDRERASRLATALATALREEAVRLPPGPPLPGELANLQQARLEAEMRALEILPAPEPSAGTVVLEHDPRFRPSPGLRFVRVAALATLDALPELLAEQRGRIQGVAIAGNVSAFCQERLRALGATRLAVAGELQQADATWANWGVRLGA
jgi:hypothetical protein